LPFAFTEHGALMAATVLNSPEAVAMSVYVVRAFIQMREQLAANREVLKRLTEIDRTLLEHDSVLRDIYRKLLPLLQPLPDPPKRRIGSGWTTNDGCPLDPTQAYRPLLNHQLFTIHDLRFTILPSSSPIGSTPSRLLSHASS
jgi:hypothetical protein